MQSCRRVTERICLVNEARERSMRTDAKTPLTEFARREKLQPNAAVTVTDV